MRSRRGVATAAAQQQAILSASSSIQRDAKFVTSASKYVIVGARMAQLVACASVIAAVVLLAQYLQELKAGSLSSTSTTLNTTGVAGEVITAGGAKVNFSDFDTDKDGAIETAEVPAALRALGIPDTDATAKEVIKKADASGDNVVSLSEFQALVAAIEGEQPLLPWWAYALIMVGVIGIALLVAYFAWKKGNWMTLLVAAIAGSSTVAALEGFLYGAPVLGGYMVLVSVGALALFLIARWVKRTVVDPVAKRLNDAVEAVQGMRKGVTDYVSGITATGVIEGAKKKLGGAADYVATTATNVASATAGLAMDTVDAATDAADNAAKTAVEAGKKAGVAVASAANALATQEAGTQENIQKLREGFPKPLLLPSAPPMISPTVDGIAKAADKLESKLGSSLLPPGGDSFTPEGVGFESEEDRGNKSTRWEKGSFDGPLQQEQRAREEEAARAASGGLFGFVSSLVFGEGRPSSSPEVVNPVEETAKFK